MAKNVLNVSRLHSDGTAGLTIGLNKSDDRIVIDNVYDDRLKTSLTSIISPIRYLSTKIVGHVSESELREHSLFGVKLDTYNFDDGEIKQTFYYKDHLITVTDTCVRHINLTDGSSHVATYPEGIKYVSYNNQCNKIFILNNDNDVFILSILEESFDLIGTITSSSINSNLSFATYNLSNIICGDEQYFEVVLWDGGIITSVIIYDYINGSVYKTINLENQHTPVEVIKFSYFTDVDVCLAIVSGNRKDVEFVYINGSSYTYTSEYEIDEVFPGYDTLYGSFMYYSNGLIMYMLPGISPSSFIDEKWLHGDIKSLYNFSDMLESADLSNLDNYFYDFPYDEGFIIVSDDGDKSRIQLYRYVDYLDYKDMYTPWYYLKTSNNIVSAYMDSFNTLQLVCIDDNNNIIKYTLNRSELSEYVSEYNTRLNDAESNISSNTRSINSINDMLDSIDQPIIYKNIPRNADNHEDIDLIREAGWYKTINVQTLEGGPSNGRIANEKFSILCVPLYGADSVALLLFSDSTRTNSALGYKFINNGTPTQWYRLPGLDWPGSVANPSYTGFLMYTNGKLVNSNYNYNTFVKVPTNTSTISNSLIKYNTDSNTIESADIQIENVVRTDNVNANTQFESIDILEDTKYTAIPTTNLLFSLNANNYDGEGNYIPFQYKDGYITMKENVSGISVNNVAVSENKKAYFRSINSITLSSLTSLNTYINNLAKDITSYTGSRRVVLEILINKTNSDPNSYQIVNISDVVCFEKYGWFYRFVLKCTNGNSISYITTDVYSLDWGSHLLTFDCDIKTGSLYLYIDGVLKQTSTIDTKYNRLSVETDSENYNKIVIDGTDENDIKMINFYTSIDQDAVASTYTNYVTNSESVSVPTFNDIKNFSTMVESDLNIFTGTTPGLVPQSDDSSNKYLSADGTWKQITASSIGAATSSHTHSNYAPLASPTFTGTPKAPTASSSTNNTQIATTAFVKTAVNTLDNDLQTQINGKANSNHTHSNYAPLASPTFTGTPKAPTPASNDDSTRIATTAFVRDVVNSAASHSHTNLDVLEGITSSDITNWNDTNDAVDEFLHSESGSPAYYNIHQIGDAIDSKANVSHSHSNYAPLASPTFTGTPKAPTASSTTDNTQIATTAFVQDVVSPLKTDISSLETTVAGKANASHSHSNYAPLASPTFTGTPKAPTATAGTNTTQIATTAFVKTAVNTLDNDLQTQINGKANSNHTHSNYASTSHTHSNYAPLASPALTGTPTAPTPTNSDDSTRIATTAFVRNVVNSATSHSHTNLDVLEDITSTKVNNWDSAYNSIDEFLHSESGSPAYYNIHQIGDAIDSKANASHSHSNYAPLASPVLTGTPTAPTASSTTDNTQIATTAFVHNVVDEVDSDLQTQINGKANSSHTHSNYASTSHTHSNYAPLASPTFTGTPKAPTATAGTNTTQIATTSFVTTAVNNLETDLQDAIDSKANASHSHSNYAPLASPALTGTPTAPTPASTDDSTRIATTAFVKDVINTSSSHSHSNLDVLEGITSSDITNWNDASDSVSSFFSGGTGTPGYVNIYEIEKGIDSKANSTHTHSNYAPLASPTFTGTPKAPTAASTDDSTRIATTAFVHDVVEPVQTDIDTLAAKSIDGIQLSTNSTDIVHFGVCSTAAATAAKTVSIPGFKLVNGSRVNIYFTYTHTASSITLNINNTGAKSIKIKGGYPIICGRGICDDRIYQFIYYNNYYYMINPNISYEWDYIYTPSTYYYTDCMATSIFSNINQISHGKILLTPGIFSCTPTSATYIDGNLYVKGWSPLMNDSLLSTEDYRKSSIIKITNSSSSDFYVFNTADELIEDNVNIVFEDIIFDYTDTTNRHNNDRGLLSYNGTGNIKFKNCMFIYSAYNLINIMSGTIEFENCIFEASDNNYDCDRIINSIPNLSTDIYFKYCTFDVNMNIKHYILTVNEGNGNSQTQCTISNCTITEYNIYEISNNMSGTELPKLKLNISNNIIHSQNIGKDNTYYNNCNGNFIFNNNIWGYNYNNNGVLHMVINTKFSNISNNIINDSLDVIYKQPKNNRNIFSNNIISSSYRTDGTGLCKLKGSGDYNSSIKSTSNIIFIGNSVGTDITISGFANEFSGGLNW